MIKIEKTSVYGFEEAIRGMRNPKNSWDKIDSGYDMNGKDYVIGENDLMLMNALAGGGSVHGKYRRMIMVYTDVTAPLYWWKEFDTYKVGTVANSCSTMHKIHAKEFEYDDFSHDHLLNDSEEVIKAVCDILNYYRDLYVETKDKKYWWQLIQLLPSSYNQKRTVMLNYEVLSGIYIYRKDHKLDEWHAFCDWIKELPYSELITCNADKVDEIARLKNWIKHLSYDPFK